MERIYLTTNGKYLTDETLTVGETKLLKSLAFFEDGARFRLENYHDIIHTSYNGLKRALAGLEEKGYLLIEQEKDQTLYLFNN